MVVYDSCCVADGANCDNNGCCDAMLGATDRVVLVHSDFKPTNVKWTTDARVLVLDCEFAWAGPTLFDVGQLLRWDPPAPFVAGFAAGYIDAGGTLPEDWRALARLLDLFNLFFFATDAANRPIRDRDVLDRIDTTLGGVVGSRMSESGGGRGCRRRPSAAAACWAAGRSRTTWSASSSSRVRVRRAGEVERSEAA